MKALLDESGVLVGFSDAVDAEGVEVPADCDLTPGRYRWAPDLATFLPVERTVEDRLRTDVDALRAIHAGFKAIEAAGLVDLPDATRQWLRQFARTIDALGE